MQNTLICSPDSGRSAAAALLRISKEGGGVHLWSAEGGRHSDFSWKGQRKAKTDTINDIRVDKTDS